MMPAAAAITAVATQPANRKHKVWGTQLNENGRYQAIDLDKPVRPPTEESSPRLVSAGTETLLAKANTVGSTNASKLNYRGNAREPRISTGHGRDTGKSLKT